MVGKCTSAFLNLRSPSPSPRAGPQVMHGYWNDDKANDEAFPYDLQSGWFDTGGWVGRV